MNTQTKTAVSPLKLANVFSSILRGMLTQEEFDKVRELNKTKEYSESCASHNFCDSNIAMIEALEALDIPFDTENEAQSELINEAWDLARANSFARVGEHTPDETKQVIEAVKIVFPSVEFSDVSWHNDASDSISHNMADGNELRIWLPNAEEGFPEYRVTVTHPDYNYPCLKEAEFKTLEAAIRFAGEILNVTPAGKLKNRYGHVFGCHSPRATQQTIKALRVEFPSMAWEDVSDNNDDSDCIICSLNGGKELRVWVPCNDLPYFLTVSTATEREYKSNNFSALGAEAFAFIKEASAN